MTKRDRIVVGVVAVVVLLGGFWHFAVKPKQAEADRLDQEIAKATERRDAALQRVAAGESARRRYRVDYATVARLGKAVPVADQVPSLVYQLEAAADNHDVDLRSLKATGSSAPAAASASTSTSTSASGKGGAVAATQAAAAVAPPGSSVGTAGFPTMPFAFKFDGDFLDVERLLSELERFTGTTGEGDDISVRGRLVTIDAVSLSAGRNGFPQVEANLSATAYVLPPGETATGGATPSGPASATGTTTAAKPAGGAPKTPTTTATVRGVTP